MKQKKKAKLIDFDYILFDIGKLAALIPVLIWLRPKWIYENAAAKKRLRGGAILMINHAGMTDPILAQAAIWYRRQHFVAATELFKTRFMRWLFGVFHCIEVDRENFNFGTFRTITEHLDAGKIVSIFPEGHISAENKEVAAFKSGVVMMALRSGSPVVPVYMYQPKNILRRTVFCIGEPIDLKATYGPMPSIEIIDQISEDLREKEIRLSELIGGKK